MGLYIMKSNESELLSMNFETILNGITEYPKRILMSDDGRAEPLYQSLRRIRREMPGSLEYLLERIEKDFKESFEVAGGQGNKLLSTQESPEHKLVGDEEAKE